MNLCQVLQDVNTKALMLAYPLELLFINWWYLSALAQAVAMTAESFYSFGFATGYFRLCAKTSDPLMCDVHSSVAAVEIKRLQ